MCTRDARNSRRKIFMRWLIFGIFVLLILVLWHELCQAQWSWSNQRFVNESVIIHFDVDRWCKQWIHWHLHWQRQYLKIESYFQNMSSVIRWSYFEMIGIGCSGFFGAFSLHFHISSTIKLNICILNGQQETWQQSVHCVSHINTNNTNSTLWVQ